MHNKGVEKNTNKPKNMRLTKFSLAFFFNFGKIDIESQHHKTKGESTASGAGDLCINYLYKYGKKEVLQ